MPLSLEHFQCTYQWDLFFISHMQPLRLVHCLGCDVQWYLLEGDACDVPFTSCADASSFYKLISREKNVWYGTEVSLNTAVWLSKGGVGLTLHTGGLSTGLSALHPALLKLRNGRLFGHGRMRLKMVWCEIPLCDTLSLLHLSKLIFHLSSGATNMKCSVDFPMPKATLQLAGKEYWTSSQEVLNKKQVH